MNKIENENVVVVHWNKGTLQNAFVESREDADKSCLLHNASLLLNSDIIDKSSKEVINKFLDLVEAHKWDDAIKLWSDEEMCEFDGELDDWMEWRLIENNRNRFK